MSIVITDFRVRVLNGTLSHKDNGHVHKTSFSGLAQSIPSNRHTHRTLGHTGHGLNLEHAHRTS